MSVWVRPLVHAEYAVAAVSFRRDGRPQHVHFTLEQIGLKSVGATGGYTCQDVFDPTHPIVTYTLKEQIVLYVPPNGIKMFRCYPLDFVDLPHDDAIQIL